MLKYRILARNKNTGYAMIEIDIEAINKAQALSKCRAEIDTLPGYDNENINLVIIGTQVMAC